MASFGKIKEKVQSLEKDLQRMELIIQDYDERIAAIDEGRDQYASMSDTQKKAEKQKLENEKKLLQSHANSIRSSYKKMEDLIEKREDRSIDISERQSIDNDLNTELKNLQESARKFRSINQGTSLDVWSARFGNVTRRIHNWWYARNNARWLSHKSKVEDRYEHPYGYLISRGGVAAAAIAFSTVLISATMFTAVPLLGPLGMALAIGYGAKVAMTFAATMYNKNRYGGPRLIQKYDFLNGPGSYEENLKNAKAKKETANRVMLNYQMSKQNGMPAKTSSSQVGANNNNNNNNNNNINNSNNINNNNIINTLVEKFNLLTDNSFNNVTDDICQLYDDLNSHRNDLPSDIFTSEKFKKLEKAVEKYRIIKAVRDCNLLSSSSLSDQAISHILVPIYYDAKKIKDELPKDKDFVEKFELLEQIVETFVNNLKSKKQNDDNQQQIDGNQQQIDGDHQQIDDPSRPQVKDYGNINLGIVMPKKKEGLNITHSKNILKKVDSNIATDEGIDRKIEAYNKLFDTPSFFSKKSTERAIAEKIHNGTATPEEVKTVIGALYKSGKDDDFIAESLSGEYDRYIDDMANYYSESEERFAALEKKINDKTANFMEKDVYENIKSNNPDLNTGRSR